MLRFILKLNTYKNRSLMILIGVFLFTGTENKRAVPIKKQISVFFGIILRIPKAGTYKK